MLAGKRILLIIGGGVVGFNPQGAVSGTGAGNIEFLLWLISDSTDSHCYS